MNNARPSRFGLLRRTAFLAATAAVVALCGCTSVRVPIETGTIEQTLPEGSVRGWWAKVDLSHPAVSVGVTAPLADKSSLPDGTEALLTPVNTWSDSGGATLAVNGNFYSKALKRAEPAATAETKPDGVPVDLVGLSVSDGSVVSPPRVIDGLGDPALVFFQDKRAAVVPVDDSGLSGIVSAVAGVGPTDNRKQPGTLLVTEGKNTGATARVSPAVRHPRTAAGVTRDGRTLILVVVDGRQKDHSIGVTLAELADLLIGLGAFDAVNLDGGGSSSFYYRKPDGTFVTNRPSDGRWRAVGNHLGVWIKPASR